MPIHLTKLERRVAQDLADLKKNSGSHSPGLASLQERFRQLDIKLDCCFLSNPYATDLFLKFFNQDIINAGKFRSLIEHYPSQNRVISSHLNEFLGVPSENIFIGNGSTEIIQAIFHNFVNKKILVPIPTFSPYLEFVKNTKVIHHQLKKANDYQLNPLDLLEDVRHHRPDAVVIINPNNPDGGYLKLSQVKSLITELKPVPCVILDISFIDFAENNPAHVLRSLFKLTKTFPNLIVLKSLSKDLGIAGLRVGVAAMSRQRVDHLLANGYLWNISGFAQYVLDLQNNHHFRHQYELSRHRIAKERDVFFRKLSQISSLRIIKSYANFFLAELIDGSSAQDLMTRLLVQSGIYIRPCGDKVGLKGEYVRIASNRTADNNYVVKSIKQAFSSS